MVRHRTSLICLSREEPVILGQWDQGQVPGMLCLRPRVMLGIQEEAGPLGEEFV